MRVGRPRSVPLAELPVNVWLVGQGGTERQRQGRYTPESVRSHPAKMLPEIARRAVETYSEPGAWILDPMSGIGTTGVEAVFAGRNYVGVELETRFVSQQRRNLSKAHSDRATGQFAVLPGDATRLARGNWQSSTGPIDVVITSPPYEGRLGSHQHSRESLEEMKRQDRLGTGLLPGVYGYDRCNIGNLRGRASWQALTKVYAGCYSVLKPGGILVVVLQSGREGERLKPLHHETARLCQRLGFDLIDEVIAVLARVAPDETPRLVAHASFWRRLAISHLVEAGCPITLSQVEFVLVFRKPSAAIGGVSRAACDKGGLSAALAGSLPR